MLNRRQVLVGTAAALGGVGGARLALGQDAEIPAGYPESYGEIIDASRSEPPLLFYSSIDNPQIAPLISGFTAKYPWITVEHLESSAYGTIERYLNEVGTNSPTASLIFTAAPDAFLQLIERDQLVEYASPEAPNLPPGDSPHPGLYVGGGDPLIFVWNKLLLPEELVPTGFAHFMEIVEANPEVFDGRMTSYGAHLTGFGYSVHYAFARHHGDKAWDWYRTIGPMTRYEQSIGTILEKIQIGEYLLAYLVANQTARVVVRNPGVDQVLGLGYMDDGTVVSTRSIAVTAAGASPNSAKLMLDFILSHEGQVLYATEGKLPGRLDVTSDELDGADTLQTLVDQVGMENIARIDYDPNMVTGYDAFVARWREANGVE